MIKSELIQHLAERQPQLTHADAERAVACVLETIAGALADGQRVELRGFGAFTVRERPAREGRNPRTGERVAVPDKVVPFFKAGKGLRERIDRARRDGVAAQADLREPV